MKKILTIVLIITSSILNLNFTLAHTPKITEFKVKQVTRSYYLDQMDRVRTYDSKSDTVLPKNTSDIEKYDTLYIVMKHEFSDPAFTMTKDYFPELDIKELTNIYTLEDPDSDLVNKEEFRNIYKIVLNSDGIDSINDAVKILESRNDIKSVSYSLKSTNNLVFDSLSAQDLADAISLSEQSSYYDYISSYYNSNNIYQAWNYTQGSHDVKIGIIDGGMDLTHPDLQNILWTNPDEIANDGIDNDGNGYVDDINGWNFANNNSNFQDSVNGHGTIVASVAGANGKNNIGIYGVVPNPELVLLRTAEVEGTSAVYDFDERISRIFAYAADKDIRILNGSFVSGYSNVFRTALSNYNGLYFASAGNGTEINGVHYAQNVDVTERYPTWYGFSKVITVTATSINTNSYGGYFNYGSETVDIAAPGDYVMVCNSLASHGTSNDYGTNGGTSLAAPYAAGVAALLMAYAPEATPLEIKEAIMNSAIYDSTLDGKCVANGKINALGAMKYLYDNMDTYSKTWDFSDDTDLNGLGIISSKTFLNGLTINPSASNRVEVMSSHKVIGNRFYNNYLALKEPGTKDTKSIKVSVMGPTDIYVTGTTSPSEAGTSSRMLAVYDENWNLLSTYNLVFGEAGNTCVYKYTGTGPANLYLTPRAGRVNIYSIAITKPSDEEQYDDTSKIWNFSDSEFNDLGNITSPTTVNGLTINALTNLPGRQRDVLYRYHFDDDQYNIPYTHELELNGDGCSAYRSVKFYVPSDSKIFITANHNGASNINRNMTYCNEFGYQVANSYVLSGTMDKSQVTFGKTPSTQVFEYSGNGECLCFYCNNGSLSIRKIQVVKNSDLISPTETTKIWNFNDSIFDLYTPGTEVDGITITRGLTSDNSNGRHLLSDSGNFNEDSVIFNIPANSEIKFTAASNSGAITVDIVDQYGILIDQVTISDTITEYTVNYTGDTNKVYIWSDKYNAKIYSVGYTTQSTNATEFNSIETEDVILSPSAI